MPLKLVRSTPASICSRPRATARPTTNNFNFGPSSSGPIRRPSPANFLRTQRGGDAPSPDHVPTNAAINERFGTRSTSFTPHSSAQIDQPVVGASTNNRYPRLSMPGTRISQSTTILFAEAEERTSHIGYVPPPIFDSTVVNSSVSTLLEEAPTCDVMNSRRPSEKIRGPRSALAPYSSGSSYARDHVRALAWQNPNTCQYRRLLDQALAEVRRDFSEHLFQCTEHDIL